MAIITSGNLTEPGLCGNIEYGVALRGDATVREVRTDLERYGKLGASISLDDVSALAVELQELRILFQRAQGSIRAKARKAFRQKLESARNQMLRQRAKGKTTHAIFSDTILFLLAKGSLRTDQLHARVKLLQPDLCDDSIDRVIDGGHFGKKWKHHVRNAQQALKKQGKIRFDNGLWYLVPSRTSVDDPLSSS